MNIYIEISSKLMQIILEDNLEVNKFILSLKNSSIFLNHQIYSRSQKQVEFFNSIGLNILFSKKECEFCLRIQHLCIFDNMMIENLTLKLDNSLNFECMVPNIINSSILFDFNEDKSLVEDNLKKIPIIIYKTKFNNKKLNHIGLGNTLVCAILKIEKNKVIEVEKDITAIVRFHNNGNINILKNAILSIMAQYGCVPNILLALQNLSLNKFQYLKDMLDTLPWQEFRRPEILKFTSNNKKDIRSKMFNESFKKATTKYVAFLDYDDIIFNDTYHFLINRLKETNKNATFGYVYASIYDESNMCITKRIKKYEIGISYEEFLMFNLFPIHSIMFNKNLINIQQIKYFTKMKYMEDYYFTLQIFNENETDWEALKIKQYIGDYIHYSSNNTLAIISEKEKEKIKNDPLYIWCDKKIQILKYPKIKKKINLFFKLVKKSQFDIVCFGASIAFLNSVEDLKRLQIEPKYICDNDMKKQDKIINGYKIYSPSKIFHVNKQYLVIITSMHYSEILKQLQQYSNVISIISYAYLRYLDFKRS